MDLIQFVKTPTPALMNHSINCINILVHKAVRERIFQSPTSEWVEWKWGAMGGRIGSLWACFRPRRPDENLEKLPKSIMRIKFPRKIDGKKIKKKLVGLRQS